MAINEQLKRHEGWREKPYLDSLGIGTFGYGFTYLTKQEGDMILANRIASCKLDLFHSLPWAGQLDEARYNVLLNMTYNMGIKRLLQFKNMLKAVQEHRFDDAEREMLDSQWAHQVHGRAIELGLQMRTGVEHEGDLGFLLS